jgi:hypothetical protein
MQHRILRRWLLTALASALVLGCRSSEGRQYPEDPLLAHKMPVEGKANHTQPVLLAHAEPAMPMLPAEAFAAHTAPLPIFLRESSATVPATPVSRERAPDTAPSEKAPLEAIPAVRQKDTARD